MKHLYFKLFIPLFLLIFSIDSLSSQNKASIWSKTTQQKAFNEKAMATKTELLKADYYQLDLVALKNELKNAPLRSESVPSDVVLEFPNSEGTFESYRIKEAPVFKAEFQVKHPNLRTYVGTSINDPSIKIRFSITPQGLHTMTLKSSGNVEFIDPISYGGTTYKSYSKSDFKNSKAPFVCHVINDIEQAKESSSKYSSVINTNDGILRTYDIAIAATVEYSNYHINEAGLGGGTDTQKKNAVKAAMVITMNRVNGIFERDLALTMLMVDNTNIIFLSEPDGYDNDNVNNNMLDANQTIIDGAIGNGNYDVGHVFSTGGGGLAQLASSCIGSGKARGATGLSQPVGDIFDVEFVAHELGHQYGANHTWTSGNDGCTAGQWSSISSYEPGSGSTIMSYAGLCSPDNVQLNADDYFHQRSVAEIWANITGDPCDTETTINNNPPTANAGGNYTIPISTPYKLTGSSSDLDGTTTHTYAWEQYDLAAFQGNFSETSTTGPLVRSTLGASPIRYVPDLEDLRFSNGSTEWEKLAAVARTINFELTVRDNGSGNDFGQTASDGMVINVVDTAGPFQITSQNSTGISYAVGSTQTVTWNVAGTNAGAMNTSNVNIRLSVDGGLTYPYLLAGTANDGSENVLLPSGIAAPFCRFMVEANPSENIFFAINSVDFAIGYTVTENCMQYISTVNNVIIPDDSAGSGVQGTAISNVINVPDNGIVSDLKVNVDVSHTFISDLVVQLEHPDGTTFNTLWARNCSGEDDFNIIFEDGAPSVVCNNPTTGTFSPATSLSVFNDLSSSGNWTLIIADFAPDDSGTLNDWYLDMCIKTITLNNPNIIGFEDLKVFPNPNEGIFNIQLQNVQSNTISLEVFDIRGRRILTQSLQASGELREEINLQNAQSGVYILNVNDGQRKATRKIIVE